MLSLVNTVDVLLQYELPHMQLGRRHEINQDSETTWLDLREKNVRLGLVSCNKVKEYEYTCKFNLQCNVWVFW